MSQETFQTRCNSPHLYLKLPCGQSKYQRGLPYSQPTHAQPTVLQYVPVQFLSHLVVCVDSIGIASTRFEAQSCRLFCPAIFLQLHITCMDERSTEIIDKFAGDWFAWYFALPSTSPCHSDCIILGATDQSLLLPSESFRDLPQEFSNLVEARIYEAFGLFNYQGLGSNTGDLLWKFV